MNRFFLCLGIFVISYTGFSQANSSWKEVSNPQKIVTQKGINNLKLDSQRLYTLDIAEFKQSLKALTSKGITVVIPNSNGKMEQFLVTEASNFVPELQAQFPNIKAYSGRGISDPKASINFSISP